MSAQVIVRPGRTATVRFNGHMVEVSPDWTSGPVTARVTGYFHLRLHIDPLVSGERVSGNVVMDGMPARFSA